MRISSGTIVAETFAILRREWRALFAWIALHVVAGVAILLALRPFVQAQLAAAVRGAPAAPLPIGTWLFVPAALLLALSLYNAVFRAVLRPAERDRFFLRIGPDELRLLALTVVLGIAFYLAMVLASFATVLIASALAALFAVDPASPAALRVVLGAMLLPMLAVLYGVIRLSPAGPLTLLRGKLMIGPAWRLARRRVLPLAGAYLIVTVLLGLAYGALVGATMAPALGALNTPDPLLRQWRLLVFEHGQWSGQAGRLLVSTIAGGVLGGLMVALHGGVAAVATRRLLEAGGSDYPAATVTPPEFAP